MAMTAQAGMVTLVPVREARPVLTTWYAPTMVGVLLPYLSVLLTLMSHYGTHSNRLTWEPWQ